MSDEHLSTVIEWAVRAFGVAMIIGMAVAGAFVTLAVVVDDPSVLWLAYVGGPLAFALRLAGVSAPLPYAESDH